LAERLIIRTTYDCILLDVNLPGKNGYELTKEIRKRQITTPVILITAFGEMDDKLFGFANGADDYITKPFYFKELLARIKVFIKRSDRNFIENSSIADLIVDHNKKQIFRNGVLIKLTPREYEIMDILVKANGNPLSKTQLLQKVWGTIFEANSNTIEVFINMLRNKIDKNSELKLIKTRIGYGYYVSID
jgi:DNA-binding response OmpR family regulator